MKQLVDLIEVYTGPFGPDGGDEDRELDDMIAHVEGAETIVHRLGVMMRLIAELRIQQSRWKKREKELETALREIMKRPLPGDVSPDSPAFRFANELRGIAIEALEEEIPF